VVVNQATVVLSESEEVLEFVTKAQIYADQPNSSTYCTRYEPRSVLSAREAKDYGLVDQIVSAS
jgi:ATP-dependent protease ClpP protease subunit